MGYAPFVSPYSSATRWPVLTYETQVPLDQQHLRPSHLARLPHPSPQVRRMLDDRVPQPHNHALQRISRVLTLLCALSPDGSLVGSAQRCVFCSSRGFPATRSSTSQRWS